jgi:hypothetical protein
MLLLLGIVAGCVKPAPTILDAYKTNCSIGEVLQQPK